MITKVMGLLLFLVGLFLIILSILSLLDLYPNLGIGERLMVFIGGLVLCLLGYIMARDRSTGEEELQ